jgi:hypothetical protein
MPDGGGTIVSTELRVVAPSEAEIVTWAELDGAPEVTVNEALVLPAGTVILAGVLASEVLLLPSVIETPPVGAGAASEMLP